MWWCGSDEDREEWEGVWAYVCGGGEGGVVCAGFLERLWMGQVVSGAAAADSEVRFWCCHIGFSEENVEEWACLGFGAVDVLSSNWLVEVDACGLSRSRGLSLGLARVVAFHCLRQRLAK